MSEHGLRIDKWLWHARFFKSRSLAQRLCGGGRVRVNGNRVTKAHAMIRPGDILTFPMGPHVRVVRVAVLGVRRGPAVEARPGGGSGNLVRGPGTAEIDETGGRSPATSPGPA
jgi:ribosome-associated heat shock protein Hsp15